MILETVMKFIRTGESTTGCHMRERLSDGGYFSGSNQALEDLAASAPKIAVSHASCPASNRVPGQGRPAQLKLAGRDRQGHVESQALWRRNVPSRL